MKKYVSILLAIILASIATACSPKFTTVSEIKERGTVKVITSLGYPPFAYEIGGKFRGVDFDISDEIAKDLEVNSEIAVHSFSEIATKVEVGECDYAIMAMSITDERKEKLDFSIPYYSTKQVIVTKNDSGITKAADLGDKTIAVCAGTTSYKNVKKTYSKARFKVSYDGESAYESLVLDEAQAFVIDEPIAKKLVANDKKMVILDETLGDEQYAVCVKKGNKEILAQINKTIERIKKDGMIDKSLEKHLDIKKE